MLNTSGKPAKNARDDCYTPNNMCANIFFVCNAAVAFAQFPGLTKIAAARCALATLAASSAIAAMPARDPHSPTMPAFFCQQHHATAMQCHHVVHPHAALPTFDARERRMLALHLPASAHAALLSLRPNLHALPPRSTARALCCVFVQYCRPRAVTQQ